jgi:hypothetical protein
MRWPWGFKPVAMTAIDILLDPGHTMLNVAKVYNATMRQSYPMKTKGRFSVLYFKDLIDRKSS